MEKKKREPGQALPFPKCHDKRHLMNRSDPEWYCANAVGPDSATCFALTDTNFYDKYGIRKPCPFYVPMCKKRS